MKRFLLGKVVPCALAAGLMASGLAACGGDDSAGKNASASASSSDSSSSSPSPGSGDAPSTLPSGAPLTEDKAGDKKATGKPLVFGLVNDDLGAAAAFPDMTAGAKATVRYINEHMNGINGRPIELHTCPTDGTPESASSCATKVLGTDPIAVIGGSDLATTASVPLITKAGKPYVGGLAFAGPENTSPLSFQFNGGDTYAWGVMGMFSVQALHAKKIGIIYPTNGVAITAAQLAQEVAVNLGLEKEDVSLVGVSPTAPDVTPAYSTVNAKQPDVVIGITTGNQCLALAQASKSLGSKAPLILPGGCMSTEQIDKAGKLYEGVYSAGGVAVNSPAFKDDEVVATYKKILRTYSPKTGDVGFASSAFQSVMNIRELLLKQDPDTITTDSIVQALRKTDDTPNVFGQPYGCKNPPLKQVPALCNVTGLMYVVKDGTLTLASNWLNPAPYIKTVPGIKSS
jgi:branched-chain amino acid transport system substrate-binding protein